MFRQTGQLTVDTPECAWARHKTRVRLCTKEARQKNAALAQGTSTKRGTRYQAAKTPSRESPELAADGYPGNADHSYRSSSTAKAHLLSRGRDSSGTTFAVPSVVQIQKSTREPRTMSLMLHMVQKHDGPATHFKKVLPGCANSTVQLVFSVTQSDRRRCQSLQSLQKGYSNPGHHRR